MSTALHPSCLDAPRNEPEASSRPRRSRRCSGRSLDALADAEEDAVDRDQGAERVAAAGLAGGRVLGKGGGDLLLMARQDEHKRR